MSCGGLVTILMCPADTSWKGACACQPAVVGASGNGKTTFIKHTFEDHQSKDFEPSDGSATSREDFQEDPASLCTHLTESVSLENGQYLADYHVQDTHGELQLATCVSCIMHCKQHIEQ